MGFAETPLLAYGQGEFLVPSAPIPVEWATQRYSGLGRMLLIRASRFFAAVPMLAVYWL
jgi:hypothetical protein